VHFLPWWLLLACLAASALAAYLLFGRTQTGDSPWALFSLTVVLAPVVLVGAAVAAIALSTLLSAPFEDRNGAPTGPSSGPPARSEGTGPKATPEATHLTTTSERTGPATPAPTASPGASPTAPPSAAPSP